MRLINAFGRICLSVCPVRALTFESRPRARRNFSFWCGGTSSEKLGQGYISRSSGQGHSSNKITFKWKIGICLMLSVSYKWDLAGLKWLFTPIFGRATLNLK